MARSCGRLGSSASGAAPGPPRPRTLLALDLHTDVAYSPAWKPLPVLFTAPLALLGDLAPAAWLVLSRAGGLAAVALAYLLAARFGGRTAGVFAAASVALANGFLRAWEHGYTEPLMAALRERVAAAAESDASACVIVGLPPELGWNAGAVAWDLRVPMAAAQGETCATPR